MGKYIGIYFVFGIGAAVLTVVQTLILWIFCSIEVCLTKQADRVLGSHVVRIGIPQVTRENGHRHLQIAHVLL